jgi:hypothetical protein
LNAAQPPNKGVAASVHITLGTLVYLRGSTIGRKNKL